MQADAVAAHALSIHVQQHASADDSPYCRPEEQGVSMCIPQGAKRHSAHDEAAHNHQSTGKHLLSQMLWEVSSWGADLLSST